MIHCVYWPSASHKHGINLLRWCMFGMVGPCQWSSPGFTCRAKTHNVGTAGHADIIGTVAQAVTLGAHQHSLEPQLLR